MPQLADDGDSPPEGHRDERRAAEDEPQRHRTSRRVLFALLALYTIGLAWGYVRLPWASVRSLADYGLIAQEGTTQYNLAGVSDLQRSYLERTLPPARKSQVQYVEVTVEWYALAVARVQSGHVVGPTGAEWKDSLYLCCFGFWIPVYTFSHAMA